MSRLTLGQKNLQRRQRATKTCKVKHGRRNGRKQLGHGYDKRSKPDQQQPHHEDGHGDTPRGAGDRTAVVSKNHHETPSLRQKKSGLN